MKLTIDLKASSNVMATPEGSAIYFGVPAARTGTQQYAGYEVGQPDKDVVEVMRSEDEVSAQASIDSFIGKWITVKHPDDAVDNTNHKDVGVGRILNAYYKDGVVLIDVIIDDADVIQAIAEGPIELSAGYSADYVEIDGVLNQANIRVNHVALVPRGRCGAKCRIGDANHPDNGKEEKSMPVKITIDGITIETTEQGAEAIGKLQKELADANALAETTDAAHKAALAEKDDVIADKDKQLGAKDAEIATLKAAQMTDAQIEAAAKDRAAIVDKAKKMGLSDPSGSNDEIVTAAVKHKFADMDLDGKSTDYIRALFDAAAVNASPNPTGGNNTADATTGDAAYAKMKTNLTNAWKGE